MTEKLRGCNRTLLEMHIGILVFGVICQIIGVFFAPRALLYTIALWSGIFGAMISAWHMYRVLTISLDQGSDAQKLIFKGYMLRYSVAVIGLILIGITDILNPLIAFLGYMSLKVTALIQPFTHKFTNWLFKETDPEPEPLAEEADCEESQV